MLIELNGHEKDSGIYKITNLVNGRIYIGSAKRLDRRFRDHQNYLNRNKHGNRFLQNDFNKCGTDAFLFEVVEVVLNKENLVSIEQIYLNKHYDNCDKCYNIASSAGASMTNRRHSQETKLKMSMSATGRTVSLKTREILSLYNKGKKRTPESVAKSAAGIRGHSYNLGRKVTEETRKNMSAAKKGVMHSAETKAKITAAKLATAYGQKEWHFVSPNNELVIIKNLHRFCSENLGLNVCGLQRVYRGKQEEYKGWKKATVKEIGNNEHSN